MELKLRQLSLNLYNQEDRFPGSAYTHFNAAATQLEDLIQLQTGLLTDDVYLQTVLTFYEVVGEEKRVDRNELLKASKETLTPERIAEDIISYIRMLQTMGLNIKAMINARTQQIQQEMSVLKGMNSNINGTLSSLQNNSGMGR